MARVTSSEVDEIIDYSSNFTSIDAFINTAHVIVEQRLADSGYTEEVLTEIERWLSAHLIATADRQTEEETIGKASVKYSKIHTGLGLDLTSYGQQVQLLDMSGLLAGASRVSFAAMGPEND